MKRISQSVGLIGCGNMGSAVLLAFLRKGLADQRRVFVSDADRTKAKKLAHRLSVHRVANNQELVQRSRVVILAVKPQDLSVLAGEIKPFLQKGQVVISILAGTPISKLKRFLGTKVSYVRAMPNLAATVGEALTVLTSPKGSALSIAELIFSACGVVVRLQESYFDLVTAICGSGPAYFFLLMELLSKAGQEGGLTRGVSEFLSVRTAFGAAMLAEKSGLKPETLRAMVTSKKGTTQAALDYLEQKLFSQIFMEGIRLAKQRAAEISKS